MRPHAPLALGLSLVLGTATAQTAPPIPLTQLDGRALLDTAIQANGAEHLRALTYRQTRL